MGAAAPTCDGLGNAVCACEPGTTCDGSDPCDGTQRSFYDRYQLGGVLGKGSQGKVYSCVDSSSGSHCAVKIIERSRKNAAEAFKRELDICQAAGRSKHLVTFIDSFSSRRFYFIVMEKYASNLRKALKWAAQQCDGAAQGATQALGNAAIRNILQQATGAVRHLHNRNIIHRDVKSQNFLVDVVDVRSERCAVVLTDFGLAQVLEPGKTLQHAVGTRKYWPPEVYDGKYSHPMDVFALGVLVFLASTGTFPYANEQKVRSRDIFTDGSVPEYLDPEAREFMRVCLDKDPSKRPLAIELCLTPWLRYKQDEEEFHDGSDQPLGGPLGFRGGAPETITVGPPQSSLPGHRPYQPAWRPLTSPPLARPMGMSSGPKTSDESMALEVRTFSMEDERAFPEDNCLAQTDQSPTHQTSDTELGQASSNRQELDEDYDDEDEDEDDEEERTEVQSEDESHDHLADHSYGDSAFVGQWYFHD